MNSEQIFILPAWDKKSEPKQVGIQELLDAVENEAEYQLSRWLEACPCEYEEIPEDAQIGEPQYQGDFCITRIFHNPIDKEIVAEVIYTYPRFWYQQGDPLDCTDPYYYEIGILDNIIYLNEGWSVDENENTKVVWECLKKPEWLENLS